jgi:ABC-type sugar transport system ATPase subunit
VASITLRDIRKSFGAVDVIKGVDLEVKSGEFYVVALDLGSRRHHLRNHVI